MIFQIYGDYLQIDIPMEKDKKNPAYDGILECFAMNRQYV